MPTCTYYAINDDDMYDDIVLCRSLTPTNGHLPSNGHVHKSRTAPRPSTGESPASNGQEQRPRNETVKYLDLELPKKKSTVDTQIEEVGYAIIRRDGR